MFHCIDGWLLLLLVHMQDKRRSSFGGEQTASDDSDADQSPPFPRRGRRQAIFDSKVSYSLAPF
jgi:hypothetical protein